MKMKIRFAAIGLLTAATVTAATLTAGSPAAAAPSCRKWQDSNTFGAACTGRPGAAYRAVAVCKNGRAVGGPYQGGNSGAWSYAYCTRVNSSLDYGYVQWYV
ncbi:hypothetical protein Drose_25955 [Dactylosporangium roseum]|uniref:Secreted protein n=1 Tax=Dactylosporangium roseum TaxID=47989 RepID=A0ABY5YZ47_9ACTN|nr:hypothetical protein [Dactylosporangium roseum]UWZ34651.1 hypothetical protein Drose_25955 [Dactylosporangium roseum]